MLTRALAQNLAIIGMLATLQEVRRIGETCRHLASGTDSGHCFDANRCAIECDDAMEALGEQQWGDDESATHKEICGLQGEGRQHE